MNVPIDIVQNKGLSLSELGLVSILYDLADDNGEIKESISEISKMSKSSKASFYKYFNSLKDKGLVTSHQPHENGRFQKTKLKLTEV